MKCDACGAPIENGVCTYCGMKFPLNEPPKAAEATEDSGKVFVDAVIKNLEDESETADASYEKKRSVWKTIGLVLLWIYFLPVMLTIYIVRNPNLSQKTKTILLAVIWVLAIAFGIYSYVTDGGKTTTTEEALSSTNVSVVTMKNADGTEQPGEISIVKTGDDVLEINEDDWFFDYVLKDDYRYAIIVDQDEKPITGIFANRNGVEKNVRLLKAGDGYYKLCTEETEYYTADVVSKELKSEYGISSYSDEAESIESAIDNVVEDAYRGPDYEVSVRGTSKRPQVIITLEKKDYDTKEYKQVTKTVAEELKKLDLNVSYLIILFQTDGSTLSAVTTVDNVSEFSGATDINWTTY